MAHWNSDWIIDRLADLLVLAYVLFFCGPSREFQACFRTANSARIGPGTNRHARPVPKRPRTRLASPNRPGIVGSSSLGTASECGRPQDRPTLQSAGNGPGSDADYTVPKHGSKDAGGQCALVQSRS